MAIIGLLGGGLLRILLPAAEVRTLVVDYHFAPPDVEMRPDHSLQLAPSGSADGKTGEPAVSLRTARILLPPNMRVEQVEVQAPVEPIAIHRSGTNDSGKFADAPNPPGAHVASGFVKDRPAGSFPRSRLGQPPSWGQLASVQRLAGCAIAVVRLFPLRDSARQQGMFAPQLKVTLRLSPAESAAESPLVPRRPDQAWERVAALVDNPELLAEYRAGQPGPQTGANPACDYLLVTKASLVSAFQPLLDQKTQEGLAVKSETLEHIVAQHPGRDPAEKLRQYLRFAYTNWGVRYVMLGGDVATIPCRYAYVHRGLMEADSLVPSDLYFACLDGSWNRDGNHRWGETTDGEGGGDVDLLAEVEVGRAPVDTPEEVAAFVEKSLRYQRQGHRYSRHALLLATTLEQGAAQGGSMLDPLLPLLSEWTVRWLDDRPGLVPRWTTTNALQALNGSPHIVLYNGHGDTDKMMRLSTSDLKALTNQEPFFAYSVGCSAGQFDNDAFSPDSIGEELVKRPRYGAFAALLNSRAGWYAARREEKFSAEFQNQFFRHLLSHGQSRLGTASTLARHEMVGHVETSGPMPYRWCYYELTLLGDPHLALKLPALKVGRESGCQIDVSPALAGSGPPHGGQSSVTQ